jgi:hypothetical protein
MRHHWTWVLGLLALAGLSCADRTPPVKAEVAEEPREAEAADERETPLESLDWLVGDWVNAGEEHRIEFSCRYSKNNAFLIRSFRITRKDDVKMSGMQVIAWDAALQTIRSWTYDSEGGFGEEKWAQAGKQYTIRSRYTLPDGGTGSAMHVMMYVDDDQFTWKSVNREIDGELQPDVEEIALVRKPTTATDKGGD